MDTEKSTKHVLEGRELIDYLVEKTSSTANAELVQREERRNRRMTILLSVLTAVGIGGAVGAIELLIKERMHAIESLVDLKHNETIALVDAKSAQLQKHFEKHLALAVNDQVEGKLGEVRTMFEQYKQYQEMLALAEIIKAEVAEDNYPETQLAKAKELIEGLAGADHIISQPHFLEGVKIVIDLLVRTDRVSEIDNLERLFRKVLVTDVKIALDLTDHYGQVIISSPHPVEELPEKLEAIGRYARASREMKYPEKALMWELFVAYKRNQFQRNPTTDSMVEMVQDLSEGDLRNFCYHIYLNSHPLHWMNKPDHEGRQLAQLVNGLLQDYPALLQTVEQQIATPELQPSIENLQARKARRMEQLGYPSEQDELRRTAESPAEADDNALRR